MHAATLLRPLCQYPLAAELSADSMPGGGMFLECEFKGMFCKIVHYDQAAVARTHSVTASSPVPFSSRSICRQHQQQQQQQHKQSARWWVVSETKERARCSKIVRYGQAAVACSHSVTASASVPFGSRPSADSVPDHANFWNTNERRRSRICDYIQAAVACCCKLHNQATQARCCLHSVICHHIHLAKGLFADSM